MILSKLEWDKLTPSERQVQDALDVAVAHWGGLDRAYLQHWAEVLGVTVKLEMVLKKAEAVQQGARQ